MGSANAMSAHAEPARSVRYFIGSRLDTFSDAPMPYQNAAVAADDGVHLLLALNNPRRASPSGESACESSSAALQRTNFFSSAMTDQQQHHRRLCHSPIKIRSPEERQRDNDAMWSPGVGQLLREASYGSSSPVIREAAEALDTTEESAQKKQRIISPSSSNEKTDNEEPPASWPPRSAYESAAWSYYPMPQHHPGVGAPVPTATQDPPPHSYYMYPPLTYPSYMSPHEPPVGRPPLSPHANPDLDWSFLPDGLHPRCVPLKLPLPHRNWGYVSSFAWYVMLLTFCFSARIGRTNSPNFLVWSTFPATSLEAAETRISLPAARRIASCVASCVSVRPLAFPRTMPRCILYRAKIRVSVPVATWRCGTWWPWASKSSGARDARTFGRGRPLVIKGRRPSVCGVVNDKKTSMLVKSAVEWAKRSLETTSVRNAVRMSWSI